VGESLHGRSVWCSVSKVSRQVLSVWRNGSASVGKDSDVLITVYCCSVDCHFSWGQGLGTPGLLYRGMMEGVGASNAASTSVMEWTETGSRRHRRGPWKR
jgi:hypothetical protein